MSEEFKVGDEVFLVYWGMGGKDYTALTTVESITPKRGDLKIKGYKIIFHAFNGQEKNRSGWSRGPQLEHATPELKAEVRAIMKRRKNTNLIENLEPKKLTDDALQAIADAIRALPPESHIEVKER